MNLTAGSLKFMTHITRKMRHPTQLSYKLRHRELLVLGTWHKANVRQWGVLRTQIWFVTKGSSCIMCLCGLRNVLIHLIMMVHKAR